MGVDVIVPWRPGCPHRQTAWDWVQTRHAHPIIEGRCDNGPWVKARAVADGLSRSTADVVVISDADVFAEDLDSAVETVVCGRPWAVPHTSVYRLNETATRTLIDTGHAPGFYDEPPYRGHLGGGVVVIRRDVYDRVPLDPRFEGWGREDDSWAYALLELVGPPQQFGGRLLHLWHPPQPRPDRKRGSEANEALFARYRAARRDIDAMRSIVAEIGGPQ